MKAEAGGASDAIPDCDLEPKGAQIMKSGPADYKDLLNGCAAFVRNEPRDAIYNVATWVVVESWGNPQRMADGLGVLLLTWNQAFYRYGSFDFGALERFLQTNLPSLSRFRGRLIDSFDVADDPEVGRLYEGLLEVLRRSRDGTKSPVATAKALHVIEPEFFALWDRSIAQAYGCLWSKPDTSVQSYLKFQRATKGVCSRMLESVTPDSAADLDVARQRLQDADTVHADYRRRTLVKMVDEYNYAKFTGKWI
jgi:hypothetical protein